MICVTLARRCYWIAEENPKVVSERLGHSTIVLTLDTYSHVVPGMLDQPAQRMEDLVGAGGRQNAASQSR